MGVTLIHLTIRLRNNTQYKRLLRHHLAIQILEIIE